MNRCRSLQVCILGDTADAYGCRRPDCPPIYSWSKNTGPFGTPSVTEHRYIGPFGAPYRGER